MSTSPIEETMPHTLAAMRQWLLEQGSGTLAQVELAGWRQVEGGAVVDELGHHIAGFTLERAGNLAGVDLASGRDRTVSTPFDLLERAGLELATGPDGPDRLELTDPDERKAAAKRLAGHVGDLAAIVARNSRTATPPSAAAPFLNTPIDLRGTGVTPEQVDQVATEHGFERVDDHSEDPTLDLAEELEREAEPPKRRPPDWLVRILAGAWLRRRRP